MRIFDVAADASAIELEVMGPPPWPDVKFATQEPTV